MSDNEPRDADSSGNGFAIFISGLALIIAMGALLAVAFKLNDNGSNATTVMQASHPMMQTGGTTQSSGTSAVADEELKIVVKSDEEHGKMGSDGSWHDAFLPADFSVKAGSTVRVVVLNYDESEHSFTSSELGTDVTVPAGSEAKPSETTFTFQAPPKAGSYEWFCAIPCDPWAMSHDGFMRGYVTVT